MILDENGFVRFNGVTDFEDSPVAACLNELFTKAYNIDAEIYTKPDGKYQRCANSKYLFSRDQTVMLTTLLCLQGKSHLVSLDRVDGKDVFMPSVRGHIKRCQGKKANWFENLWLKADILFHAYFTPTEESNQLIAQMIMAGQDYLKLWVDHNPQWDYSIRRYFYLDDGAWRDEEYLAHEMCKQLRGMIA